MKLTWDGLKEKEAWDQAGIVLPGYDVQQVARAAKENPQWAHFGIGNIFRVFLGGIADQLLESGEMDRGITCVETFDFDVADQIYTPFDNLVLSVILHGDGRQEKKVLGSLSESVKGKWDEPAQWNRLKEIFGSAGLQFASFTITEKGYALKTADGDFFPYVQADLENGPEKASCAMAIVTAMLHQRFLKGAAPMALVSMDNCSKNGEMFREAIRTVALEWQKRGFVGEDFVAYVSDESKISFPWTMIDKITPRPSEKIAAALEASGVENMQPVITDKRTYIAPFVNAEGPQYLVIEDAFPNGRPALEKAGVYMTDRDTVNKSERMKVTACLNPIHTALGPYGHVLGYELFSDEMKDPDMLKLANLVGYAEGMEVVPDPKILSPKAFLDECMNERFPNPYLGDTCLRLCTDASQGLGVRFGVTVKAFMDKYGDAKRLQGIPLAIAGWLRYMLAIDDQGKAYELAPDPMNEVMTEQFAGIEFGKPESVTDQLKWILSNENIFFVNLYEAGIGEEIEAIFKEEIAGVGAVRAAVQKYLA